MMAQIIFNMWIYQSFGGKALSYLLIGTALALGVHPTAGHFIAEHYMFCKGQGKCFKNLKINVFYCI